MFRKKISNAYKFQLFQWLQLCLHLHSYMFSSSHNAVLEMKDSYAI